MYHPTTELHTLNRESQIAQESGLTDCVSAASVKAGAAGASGATAPGAGGVTAKLVGCIR
jgi:hypothetical protein